MLKMSNQSANTIVNKLLRLTDQAIERLEYGPAFVHLSVLLEIAPHHKSKVQQKFVTCLCNYGRELESNQCYSEVFKFYESALKWFPDCETLFNNLASHLIRLGYNEEGEQFVKKALAINSQYLPALTNLQIVKSNYIERWHYRMLNDSKRNLAYKQAIGCRIREGYNQVLDIGSGTLILSMYAAEYHPEKIYSCDYSPIMSKIASEVMVLNKMENSIKLFNINSNQISIPEHIEERVSLVITETMDAGLFGEHILSTLQHAWENLLLPPKSKENPELPHGCVIPLRATVYAVPIECSYIRQRNIYDGEKKQYFKHLNLCSMLDEPYDCEKLNQLPGGYVLLAEPRVVMEVNFNDPSEINYLLSTENQEMKTVNYQVSRTGVVDAIASWFVVHLTEDIVIDTLDTQNENCCWEQSLFIYKKTKRVKPGEELTVQFKWQNDHFVLNLYDKIEDPLSISLDREIISFLNDDSQVKTYINTAKQWYSENQSNFQNITILDLCPFPIFGLEVLSLDSTNGCDKVQLFYSNENLTEALWKCNPNVSGNAKKKINLFDQKKNTQKFDVIIMNYINFYGELNISLINELTYFKQILRPNGIILPTELSIKCQLVYSKWLPQVSSVVEHEICNVHIRNLMNTYSVNHHLDVFKNLVTSIRLSNCQLCLSLASDQMSRETSTVASVPITADGCLNAIVYFFEINIYHDHKVTTGNEHSYVNQCAFIVERPSNVHKGDTVAINVMYDNGHLQLNVNS
ncbi:protein arginine N-methyltransferase 9-like [Adelges cooleyi]|uniref:protein arginine N-methyltransferase 9-like n=1 Tax=Adelges cooleyi TaxID=133065 RepID=UPI00217F7DE3|nr:protein arginine N-methyltransferase 9-like [Adelges cooleyi]